MTPASMSVTICNSCLEAAAKDSLLGSISILSLSLLPSTNLVSKVWSLKGLGKKEFFYQWQNQTAKDLHPPV